jgi:hypothetical protein
MVDALNYSDVDDLLDPWGCRRASAHELVPAMASLDGQVLEASDALVLPRQEQARLRCLSCGELVFARATRLAGVRFVHRSGAHGRACSSTAPRATQGSLETPWHAGAKALLMAEPRWQVPAMQQGGVVLCPARTLSVEDVCLEAPVHTPLGRLRLDVLAWYAGQPLGVEVTVTHALSARKLAQASSVGLALLEVDLRDHGSRPWDALLAHALVIEGVHRKRWHVPTDNSSAQT